MSQQTDSEQMNVRAALAALRHWREISNTDVLVSVIHTVAAVYLTFSPADQQFVNDAFIEMKWGLTHLRVDYDRHPGAIADQYAWGWSVREMGIKKDIQA